VEKLQGENDYYDEMDDKTPSASETKSAPVEKLVPNDPIIDLWDEFTGKVRMSLYKSKYEDGVSRVSKSLHLFMGQCKIALTKSNVDTAISIFDQEANDIGIPYQLWKGERRRAIHQKYINGSTIVRGWYNLLGYNNGGANTVERSLKKLKSVACVALGVVGVLVTAKLAPKHPKPAAGLGGISLALGVAGCRYAAADAKRLKGGLTKYKLLEDTCSDGNVVTREMHPNAIVTMPTFYKCQGNKYKIGFTIDNVNIVSARSCTHNELQGLLTRMLIKPFGKQSDRVKYWKEAQLWFSEQVNNLNTEAEEGDLVTFVSRYTLARRKQIKDAIDYFKDFSVTDVSSLTKAFVKFEWVSKLADKFKPRIISGKPDDYLGLTGPEYKAFQDKIKNLLFKDGRYIYTGGMTGEEIGAIMARYEAEGYKVLENDLSAYDGHTEVEAIKAEMDFYRPYLSTRLMTLLRKQYRCDGRTLTGIIYKCIGKFCSGVINTSFGNTIRNFIMTGYILWKLHGITDFAMICLGDDNVIFYKSPLKIDLDLMAKDFELFGHESNLVDRGYDYDLVEYCSGRPWRTANTRVLGPKVFRVLSKMVAKDRHYDDNDMDAYMRGVLIGNRYNDFIPVLGEVFKRLKQDLGRGKTYKSKDLEHKSLLSKKHVRDSGTWEMFTKIYGLDQSDVKSMLNESNLISGGSLSGYYSEHGAIVDGLALN
jgi:hypothetical protein